MTTTRQPVPEPAKEPLLLCGVVSRADGRPTSRRVSDNNRAVAHGARDLAKIRVNWVEIAFESNVCLVPSCRGWDAESGGGRGRARARDRTGVRGDERGLGAVGGSHRPGPGDGGVGGGGDPFGRAMGGVEVRGVAGPGSAAGGHGPAAGRAARDQGGDGGGRAGRGPGGGHLPSRPRPHRRPSRRARPVGHGGAAEPGAGQLRLLRGEIPGRAHRDHRGAPTGELGARRRGVVDAVGEAAGGRGGAGGAGPGGGPRRSVPRPGSTVRVPGRRR